jgi:hypothetical protein
LDLLREAIVEAARNAPGANPVAQQYEGQNDGQYDEQDDAGPEQSSEADQVDTISTSTHHGSS